jgi:uncharacterized membrane protein YhaH (DUF805 family)
MGRRLSAMDSRTLLFTTGGRINRAKFIGAIVAYACALFLFFFTAVFLLTTDWRNAPLFVYVCFGLLLSLSFFSIVAVAIKRLHDRDKVGWWAVPFVILPGLLSSAASDLVIRSLAPYFMHALACYCCGALSSWPVYVAHLVRTSLGPILCNLDQC